MRSRSRYDSIEKTVAKFDKGTSSHQPFSDMLLDWDKIEPWQQDNEYILRHYRPSSNNHWKSITSLCYLHNQSVNVYTHLLAALGFVAIAWFTLDSHFSFRYGTEDRFLIGFFLLGAMFCFCSSAYFHLSRNHSPEVVNFWLTMDFFGIICLIVGTAFPLAYYSYPCRKTTLQLCWASVSTQFAGSVQDQALCAYWAL